jgi:putative membrane protein
MNAAAADPGATHAALTDSTLLALDRTRLAFDRTTMAWVRTATSLISFCFSVYKFFQVAGKGATPGAWIGPREFALMMIGIGIVALMLGTVQHVHSMNILRRHYRGTKVPRSLAVLVGALVAILGIIALIVVIERR